MFRERKTVKFEVKAIDEETGIFSGYAAIFSKLPDFHGDIIDFGAFTKTLKEGGKRIKILWNHSVMEPIGKPIEMIEDEKGLYVEAKLSLGVQRAREVLCLMKDGVITEMSIGYDTLKQTFRDGIRYLKEVKVYDISPVTFAANTEAVIMGVKTATIFDDLPLADREKEWDGLACERRVRAWAGGIDNMNWDKYCRAFLWFDENNPELLGSYKLGFADVINGRLIAIPRGLFACAVVLRGGRGGVNIPADAQQKVIAHIDKYYAKMDKESPFKSIIPKDFKSLEEFYCLTEEFQYDAA